ncbi:MAG: hypothetical protein RR922_01215 [Clostridia bacterium]
MKRSRRNTKSKNERKSRKIIYILGGVLCLVFACAAAIHIDYSRVKKGDSPIFALKVKTNKETLTKEYISPLYKIVEYSSAEGKQGTEIGTPFLKADSKPTQEDEIMQQTKPKEYIDIRGVVKEYIKQESGNVAHIEGEISKDTLTDSAAVSITKDTKILDADGKEIPGYVLKVGDYVEVKFTDNVLETYPVKADAKEIKVMKKEI